MTTKLLLIGDVTAAQKGGQVLLSKKFVTGMQMYAEHWPGELHAVLQPAELDVQNLDVRAYSPDALGFKLELRTFGDQDFYDWFQQLRPDLVMGGANHLLMDIVDQCDDVGARFVCCTEYNFKTNLQIIRAGGGSILKQAKSAAWMMRHMRQRRQMVRRAAGLQANGTPTFAEYRGENDNALLYFDSRIRPDMIVSVEERDARRERLRDRARPLRLLFSGRLNEMKGADHLLAVASILKRRGFSFLFDICGDGTLRAEMESQIQSLGLAGQVRMKGVLDFEQELVPFARREIDFFVCCHRQGDPSCSYLETAACGVPIFGYDNEAFVGILQRYKIGLASKMNDPQALARLIENARVTPLLVDGYVEEAVRFAEENTYDRVFAARVSHLRSVAGV